MSGASSSTLAIVGVGLIGGSIGLAARRTGRFSTILGVGRDPDSLHRATALRCIDEAAELPEAAKRADVVVFCTPVDQVAKQVLIAAKHCKARTLLTDAGSTKASIVAAVDRRAPSRLRFVGAHPLAGSEKRGAEHARADLFDGRLTILTPTKRTPGPAVTKVSEFWESLGCKLWAMTPDEHDRVLAQTSHLPHLVASALASTLEPGTEMFTATGFRDTTRLAGSDPALWTAILEQNSANVVDAVAKIRDRLNQFHKALRSGDSDTLLRLLQQGKAVRDSLSGGMA